LLIHYDLGKRTTKGELLLVPVELVPAVWDRAYYLIRRKGQAPEGYDIKALYQRLLLGRDRLWLAVFTHAKAHLMNSYGGMVISTVGPPPKDLSHVLFTRDRSITVHVIAARKIYSWFDDAVEKITAYGLENECRQCFAMGRQGWFGQMKKFYGRFERVGIGLDRLKTRGRDTRQCTMRPGYFRRIEPWPEGVKFWTAASRKRQFYLRGGRAHAAD